MHAKQLVNSENWTLNTCVYRQRYIEIERCASYTHLSLESSNPCNKIGRENALYINTEWKSIRI